MMAEHTPGPWGYISDEITAGPFAIAVICPWLGESKSEQEANARLIAAAPELLEALDSLLRPKCSATWLMGEDREKVLSAIAKAKGN